MGVADGVARVTFLQLQDDALEACNYNPSTVAAVTRTRFKRRINQWQRRLLKRPGYMRLLRDRQMTLTTAAGTHTYSFATSVVRLHGVTDQTNDESIVRRDLGWLRRVDPGLDTTGIPEAYVFLGPSSAGLLQIQFWPTPAGAYVYRIDHTAQLVDLSADADTPLLPEDFHHVLSLGAQHDEWLKLDDDRLATVRADLEQEIKGLNAYLWDLADSTDERRDSLPRTSRLGPYYPAGT